MLQNFKRWLVLSIIGITLAIAISTISRIATSQTGTAQNVGNVVNAVAQNNPQNQFSAWMTPINSITSNSTSYVVGSIFYGQIYIPTNSTLTGACLLNGATVGTTKVILALYGSTGRLISNTAVAGTLTSGASVYQCIAFTATASITGPGSYYVAVQGDNVTDNFQTYAATSVPTGYGTNSQTGVFATLATLTTPGVAFNANKGPIMQVW